MLNYNESLEYLLEFENSGIKYDLDNITRILEELDNPQRNFTCYHIAGTNGKGTVSALLYSFFQEQNISCGQYTSPHIVDFRERISVNGNFISTDYITKFVNEFRLLLDEIEPTFFEAVTSLAFKYFSDEKIKVAIIETGLGGRLDSTNVIDPYVSIITGISLDHVQYLGDTIEKIASEKAGIIKLNKPVIHPHLIKGAEEVISAKAKEMNSKEIISNEIFKIDVKNKSRSGQSFDIKFMDTIIEDVFCPLIGDFQFNNFATALTAYLFDDYKKEPEIIKRGFANVIKNSFFHSRFEIIKEKPYIITDVAHNPEGISNLKSNLNYINYKKLFIIFGMMKDKNYPECIKMLESIDATIVLTRPDNKRSASPDALLEAASDKSKYIIKNETKDAVKYVLDYAGSQDAILVVGSFYLVCDFLKAINFKYF